MTIVSVDSSSDHLQLESIPLVDLRFFSQSELNSLSLCSDEAFDLNRCDDVVIPKIDRSVFNESAGSRKQTYSRLRLAPRKPQITSIGRRRRCTSLLPVPKPPPNPIDDPESKENKKIVSLLQDLFARENPILINRENAELPSLEKRAVPEELPPIIVADGGSMKKKRGRKRKYPLDPIPNPSVQGDDGAYENGSKAANRVMEIVNRNGVVVDIAALANMEDPFGPEMKRRTVGLETEVDLLGFLKGLEGQWGSRRKKRKIVDASDFGDALPNGWKLLLSLKRKEGRFWLNCRRYISPNGRQFVSCKDVSSFLLSIFGPQNESHPTSHQVVENNFAAYKLASGSTAGFTQKSPITSLSTEHDNQATLLGAENLAEVEIRDLLECHKCNMSFDEKDAYLEHLLLSHQRSAKKCRLGTSIGDGVIIKDGKYECQFCHKIFHERHRYNGHVGIHVKNYVRSLEPSPGKIDTQKNAEPLSASGVPSGVSKVDTLDNVDKGSSQLTSTAKPDDEMNVGSPHGKLEAGSIPETSTAKSNYELSVGFPYENQETGGCIPQTPATKPITELNVGSSQLTFTAKPDDEMNVDSHGKPEVGSIPETSTAKSNYDGKQETGGSILQSPAAKPIDELNVGSSQLTSTAKPDDEMNVGSPHRKPEADSIPETSTAKSNYELNVGFPYGKQETGGSIPQTPAAKPIDELNVGSPRAKLGVGSNPDNYTAKSNHELNVDLSHGKQDTGANNINRTLAECSHDKQDSVYEMTDDKVGKIDEINNNADAELNSCLDTATALSNNEENSTFETYSGNYVLTSTNGEIDIPGPEKETVSNSFLFAPSGNEKINGVETVESGAFSITAKQSKLSEAEESGNNEPETGFCGSQAGSDKHAVTENIGTSDEVNILQSMVGDTLSPLVQSSDCFPTLNMISDKGLGENDFCSGNQKLENISDFEELRLNDMEPSKFCFVTGQDSNSLPEESMDLSYDVDMEQGLDTSVQFVWEAILPNMDNSQQLSTVCVWCGISFNHESINPEMQSDSVGFMCPTCKAKISGQLNDLDNGLSMNFDKL